MLEWILFLPILFPLVGAFAWRLAAPRVSPHIRPRLAFVFIVLEILAVLANIAPFNHRLFLSDWPLASFSLVLQMDGIGILLLTTIFVIIAALWLITPPRAPIDPLSVFVWTGAVLLILAGNLITVYFAWVLLDLAILVWRLVRDIERQMAVRAFALSQLAGFALFAGSQFLGTPNGDRGIWLIGLAYWARLGLFPFHWTLPTRGVNSRDLWNGRAIPLIAGASLWVRWSALQIPAPWQLIVVLTALALCAALVWTWREEQPSRIATACAWHVVALIPIAIAYGGDGGMALALWLTLNVAMALAFFEVGLRWRAENRNRWARLSWFAGLFTIAGLPLTPAFLGRVGLYVSIWESADKWLVLITGIVTWLILLPLWNVGESLEGTEPRDPTRAENLGLQILILAWIVLSFAPMLIAHALAPEVGNSAEAVLRRVIWTNDLTGVVIGFVATLLPFVLSTFMRGIARRFHPQPLSPIPRTARLLDLDWLETALAGIGYEMGAAARNLSALAEENPTVWILLVALWIAIFVLLPR
ncbi:MAG TPA: hypothetical protein VF932_11895 [Anaerolineae bacterium]